MVHAIATALKEDRSRLHSKKHAFAETTAPKSDTTWKKMPALHEYPMQEFDEGLFALSLLKMDLLKDKQPGVPSNGEAKQPEKKGPNGVEKGTMLGTRVALQQMIKLSMKAHSGFFAATQRETIIPQGFSLDKKRQLYQWDRTQYPPHCKLIPESENAELSEIFNGFALNNIKGIIARIVPDEMLKELPFMKRLGLAGIHLLQDIDAATFNLANPTPDNAISIKDVEDFNDFHRATYFGAYNQPNVGDREDWYSDEVFAEQQFIGNNPCTIEKAPKDLVSEFIEEARKQKKDRMLGYLTRVSFDSLYVQDCRYFREAVQFPYPGKKETTQVPIPELKDPRHKDGTGDYSRYGCAPVTLFHLNEDGQLHPLAICIDYKGSMSSSVTIFNQRVFAHDSTAFSSTDWPWRYAKTCAQVGDWIRHEIQIHLVNTHLIEEAVIVSANRSFSLTHPVYGLLSPHWRRTLSVNAAARALLVPEVVVNVVGLSTDQALSFINHSYSTFDWQSSYVPNDLTTRGFPLDEIPVSRKFHNYAYGRGILKMWHILHKFVLSTLTLEYGSDSAVAADPALDLWCAEMSDPDCAGIHNFPKKFSTLTELADAVTMAIHIASPQHSAVNYLQQYYMTFVINKPAALTTPLPSTISDLLRYTERHLVAALPLQRPREYLLMSHVPWLLNFKVEEEMSLVTFANTVYQSKFINFDEKQGERSRIGEELYADLRAFQGELERISEEMDGDAVSYRVLDPYEAANSILI